MHSSSHSFKECVTVGQGQAIMSHILFQHSSLNLEAEIAKAGSKENLSSYVKFLCLDRQLSKGIIRNH